MLRTRICLVLLPLGVLAACQPRAQTVEPAAAVALTDTTVQRYTCEQGHRIVVTGGTALVELADGRRLILPAAGTGAWRGEALDFVVTADRGSLSQDEVGTFLCTRAV